MRTISLFSELLLTHYALGSLHSLRERCGWSGAIEDDILVVNSNPATHMQEISYKGVQAILRTLRAFVGDWKHSTFNKLPSKLHAIDLRG